MSDFKIVMAILHHTTLESAMPRAALGTAASFLTLMKFTGIRYT